jgi:ankyrin repeat protein
MYKSLGESMTAENQSNEKPDMVFDQVHRMIKRGDITWLRDAFAKGLDPNLTNRYSWTILMLAALGGKIEVGRIIIENGAALDTRNSFRDTALSLAIQSAHPSFVRLLLSNGASMDCHPHGNSLEIFIDWVERYSQNSQETIQHIRNHFDLERDSRSHRNQS